MFKLLMRRAQRGQTQVRSQIELRRVSHAYGPVMAVSDIDLTLTAGEIHAIVGENGAGKSTVVKVIAGAIRPTRGEVLLDGAPVEFRNPRQSLRAGIAVVYQDTQIFPDLTVAENIFGGAGLTPSRAGFVLRRSMRRRAAALFKEFEIDIDPDARAGTLGAAERKLVDVARALAADARFVVLDEPTASLEPSETERLLALMAQLAGHDVGIVFITHRLDEVLRACARVTVIREGHSVGTFACSELTSDGLIELIVGGHPEAPVPIDSVTAEIAIALRGAHLRVGAAAIDLEVGKGEIVALTGLLGSGARDALRMVAGRRPTDGQIEVRGKRVRFRQPLDGIRSGIGYIPEDRKREGLIAEQSIETNIALPRLGRLATLGFVNRSAVHRQAATYVDRLAVRCSSPSAPITSLSGGNQQKVLIAKWLAAEVDVLLIEEPTQGVDIGARAEIHRYLAEFARDGGAVLMVSTDLNEIANVAHRVLVVRHGEIVATLMRPDITEEAMTRAASGLGSAA